MSYAVERRLLQIAVALAGAFPVVAGFFGLIGGLGLQGPADSHFRFLSGLQLGVGAAFWATIPKIETRTDLYRVLTLIVAVGGLARLGAALASRADAGVWVAIVLELGFTPLTALWRERIERMDASRLPGYRGPWE
jgi:hypothetical protein